MCPQIACDREASRPLRNQGCNIFDILFFRAGLVAIKAAIRQCQSIGFFGGDFILKG
jgi:hypothetical protein